MNIGASPALDPAQVRFPPRVISLLWDAVTAAGDTDAPIITGARCPWRAGPEQLLVHWRVPPGVSHAVDNPRIPELFGLEGT